MPDREVLASTLEILADDLDNIKGLKKRFLENFPDIEKLSSKAKNLNLKDELFFDNGAQRDSRFEAKPQTHLRFDFFTIVAVVRL